MEKDSTEKKKLIIIVAFFFIAILISLVPVVLTGLNITSDNGVFAWLIPITTILPIVIEVPSIGVLFYLLIKKTAKTQKQNEKVSSKSDFPIIVVSIVFIIYTVILFMALNR